MNRATSATGWVRNPDGTLGWTTNPITGCLNHIDGMCKGGNFPCYAYKLANGRLKQRYLANPHIPRYDQEPFDILDDHQKGRKIKALNDPFYPRFWEERLGQIPLFGKTLGIFVCDMGELFGDWLPRQWTQRVLNHIGECQRHRFYLLTKQPQNLIKFSPFPENCWVGITCTNTEMFAQSLIKAQGMEAKVKFISFEPLLEWNWNNIYQEPLELVLKAEGIGWLIIGAQTKPYKPPKIEWVEEIIRAADRARVKVFLKDNLRTLVLDALARHQIERGQFLVERELRQEMPQEVKYARAVIHQNSKDSQPDAS